MRRIVYCILVTVILAVLIPIPDTHALSISIRVGYNTNLPPFQYLDENGEPTGLHIELLNEIARTSNLQLEYYPFDNTFEAVDAMLNGDLDIVLGVNPKKYSNDPISFTDILSSSTLCLLADNRNAQRYQSESRHRDMNVTLDDDVASYPYMGSMDFASIIIKDNQINAFETQRAGYADMLISVKDSILWILRERGLQDQYTIVTNYMLPVSFAIATHPDDMSLRALLNTKLTLLRTNGQYEEMINRWILADDSGKQIGLLRNIIIVAGALLAGMTVYLMINLRIKKLLAQEVAVRTEDLNKANEEINIANQKLEQRIEQTENYNRFLYNIIEASPAAMLLIDKKGKVIHSNRRALQLQEAFEGKADFAKGIGILYRKILCMDANEILLPEKSSTPRNISLTSGDGKEHKYRFSIHNLMSYNVNSGVLVSVEDVTAEELEKDTAFEKQKNEALNQMIAGLAHEIKNPLTTISAAAEMILTNSESQSFWEAFFKYVPNEIDRINRLVQNLVYYARPSQTQPMPVNLKELILAFQQLIAPITQRNEILVEFQAEQDLYVMADKDKLNQVLFNLILNSIESIVHKKAHVNGKYEPLIKIWTKQADSLVIISVWDNGTGMTRTEIENCIKPLFTTKKAGTGLGLSVSDQYIREIGGRLTIESESGSYSCFTVSLPLASAPIALVDIV